MKISRIIELLEGIAPQSLQENYDNCGLITGNIDWEIKNILVTLDTTEDVVDEAIKRGCNFIIAHHPIVFFGLKKINGNNYVERVIIKAIKNDIAIFSIHTNLDKVNNGVNAKILEKIGCINNSPLQALEKKLSTGGTSNGMVGFLQKPEFVIDFLLRIKDIFNCGSIKYTSTFDDKEIKKIAVCGGAGSFLIKDAIKCNADIFITSDITYHQFFDSENKIVIADIGHYESEQFTKELLFDFLHNFFPEITVETGINFIISQTKTNPVNYI